MRGVIQREVSRIRKRIIDAKLQITIATSGTPRPLGTRKLRGYDESKPQTVPRAAVASQLESLSKRNLAQRRAMPGIGPRRAEIIIAGPWSSRS